MSCGGGGDSAALVERLPGDARALSAIDLAVVKARLGLPEDTDPDPAARRRQRRGRGPPVRLHRRRLPYLARFDRTLMQAIDESRVTQAASTPVSGPDAVVVLATDQPFDDGSPRASSARGTGRSPGCL